MKIFPGQPGNSGLSTKHELINEYRLNLMEAKSRNFLKEEMEKFFFSDEPPPPLPPVTSLLTTR